MLILNMRSRKLIFPNTSRSIAPPSSDVSIPHHFSVRTRLVSIFLRKPRRIVRDPTIASRILCYPAHEFTPISAHPPLSQPGKRICLSHFIVQPARISRRIIRLAHDELSQSIKTVPQMSYGDTERSPLMEFEQGFTKVFLPTTLVPCHLIDDGLFLNFIWCC